MDQLQADSKSDKLASSFDPLVLPAEITAQIFLHGCQIAFTNDGRWKREFDPLLFGQISSSWRNFAWSTPELWSSVDISLRDGGLGNDWEFEKWDEKLTLLQQWLARAKGCAMDIYMDTNDLPIPPCRIIEELTRHCKQWRTLHLRMPTAWCGFFSLISNTETIDKPSFPRLQSFHFLEHNHLSNPTSVGPLKLNLTDAPALNELIVENPTIQCFRLPSEQITRFIVLPARKVDLGAYLTSLPNIVEAHFNNAFPMSGRVHTPCRHSNLRRLHASFHDEYSLDRFLVALSLPGLEFLEVDLLWMSSQTSMKIIHPFLHRSGCKLTRLVLGYAMKEKSEEDIISLLENIPSLREITIHIKLVRKAQRKRGLTRLFFEYLNPMDHPSYLPFLEALTYNGPLLLEPEFLLESLVLRAASRDLREMRGIDDEKTPTQLRRLRIKDDYQAEKTVSDLSLDPRLLITLRTLLLFRYFELVNRDGTDWLSA